MSRAALPESILTARPMPITSDMKQSPIISSLWNVLTAPSLPPLSLSITESHLVLLALRHRRGEFETRHAALSRLAPGLVNPAFAQPNIADEDRMLDALTRAREQAGLKKIAKINVSLPAGSARSFVISLDSTPGSKAELAQLIEWKVERATGYKYDELQVSHRRLHDFQGRPQWMVSTVHQNVLSQYQSLFDRLGWKAGLIVPQHVGEAAWLLRSELAEDQMMVSVHEQGFDVVIVRDREPILIREVECSPEEPEEMDNEFYRLVIFYRDRLVPAGESASLNRVLIIGSSAEQQRFRDLVSTALEKSTASLTLPQLGLRLDPGLSFPQIAAAAGLSAMAWGK